MIHQFIYIFPKGFKGPKLFFFVIFIFVFLIIADLSLTFKITHGRENSQSMSSFIFDLNFTLKADRKIKRSQEKPL